MTRPPDARPLSVFNIGLDEFARTAATAPNAQVQQLDWRPPLDGQASTAEAVSKLTGVARIDSANAVAISRFLATDTSVIDVQPARSAIAILGEHGKRTLLHAGPPIAWDDMCGPMRGALIGAVLFEGWAQSPTTATDLLASGSIELSPCHHSNAVGPMAGVISPSMPVWIVEDAETGRRSFSNLNEGLGKVLRFGAYDAVVIERLQWMTEELGPVLSSALRAVGPVSLSTIMAQALHMGDEVHNRNTSATGQLLKRLAGPIAGTPFPSATHAQVLTFIGSNDHFFLNLSMAACKLQLDAASGVSDSSMVTAMARNGVNFGIRVSGLGDRWFEAPASVIDGLYFAGYGPDDGTPDLGDSSITETAGLGGFAMAAAPAIVGFVGGTATDALNYTTRMRHITIAENPRLTIAALGFQNTSLGIDLRLVVDTGILPVINTGIAHREAGIGQIGAGITSAPFACFAAAAKSLVQEMSLG